MTALWRAWRASAWATRRYAVLQGGMAGWLAEKRPVDTLLPAVTPSRYPESSTDDFTVDYRRVLNAMQDKKTVIIDVQTGRLTTPGKSPMKPGPVISRGRSTGLSPKTW